MKRVCIFTHFFYTKSALTYGHVHFLLVTWAGGWWEGGGWSEILDKTLVGGGGGGGGRSPNHNLDGARSNLFKTIVGAIALLDKTLWGKCNPRPNLVGGGNCNI
jgi:hypothetical protein